MEISGGQPSSTSHQTQATSSSVIVQSSQPEEGVSLTSLSDIHQSHHQQTPSVSGIGSGSISSIVPPGILPHSKLHPLHHLHAQQTSAHFGSARISASIQQASSSSASPILSPPGKTLGRNNNGTSKFN